jgi:hypothetical protein
VNTHKPILKLLGHGNKLSFKFKTVLNEISGGDFMNICSRQRQQSEEVQRILKNSQIETDK